MDLTPDHRVLMGAVAVWTLAATDLATSPVDSFIRDIHGGIVAAIWVTWSGASALYALLAAATFRRWIAWSAARQSDIRWWASVFPLGMYSGSTFALVHVTSHGAQRVLALATFWTALGAGCLAGWMSVRTIARNVKPVHT
jgi:tellurite resistance protein TehA-like permease